MRVLTHVLVNLYVAVGRYFERRGKNRTAVRIYRLAAHADPNSIVAHVRLGHSARKATAYRTAENAFAVALRLEDDLDVAFWRDEMRRLCKKRRRSLAGALRAKLWGGHEEAARADLEALLDDASQTRVERCHAAWALAQWHFVSSDFARALALAVAMRDIDPRSRLTRRQRCLEADCLLALGRLDDGRAILEALVADRPDDPHLLLRLADAALWEGSALGDARRLEIIGRIFTAAGLARVEKISEDAPLALDNLMARAPLPQAAEERPLVSVIVPAYSSAGTIGMALRGLITQTWEKLEIIVVDDCSPDDTVQIVEAFARDESRVRLLRQNTNQGAYAARNAGLAIARGRFITTHDADDWSHPQKIALQTQAILAAPHVSASISYWARSTRELNFRGMVRPLPSVVQLNHSSLMVRREAIDVIGPWDAVRIAADTEFMKRVELHYGIDGLVHVLPGVPLSFSLDGENTALTRAKQTHVLTIFHGVRRTYREAWRHWHATAGVAARLDGRSPRAPFPAPALILPERCDEVVLNALVEGDFDRDKDLLLARAIACAEAGLSVGIRDMPAYETEIDRPMPAEVWNQMKAWGISVVAPQENVLVVGVGSDVIDNRMQINSLVMEKHNGN